MSDSEINQRSRTYQLSIPGLGLLIADIVIGTIYLEDCPVQPYIPIYLIVSGVFGLVLALLSCLSCNEENPLCLFCTSWNYLTSLFLFCWFIAGNVWIFSIYEPNYSQTRTDLGPYCDKTLYLYSFWSTIVGYILMGISLAICCLCGLCGLSGFCCAKVLGGYENV